MKTKNKERKVVNLNSTAFLKIQDYCTKNSLNMCRWLENIALDKIYTDTSDTIVVGTKEEIIQHFLKHIDTDPESSNISKEQTTKQCLRNELNSQLEAILNKNGKIYIVYTTKEISLIPTAVMSKIYTAKVQIKD